MSEAVTGYRPGKVSASIDALGRGSIDSFSSAHRFAQPNARLSPASAAASSTPQPRDPEAVSADVRPSSKNITLIGVSHDSAQWGRARQQQPPQQSTPRASRASILMPPSASSPLNASVSNSVSGSMARQRPPLSTSPMSRNASPRATREVMAPLVSTDSQAGLAQPPTPRSQPRLSLPHETSTNKNSLAVRSSLAPPPSSSSHQRPAPAAARRPSVTPDADVRVRTSTTSLPGHGVGSIEPKIFRAAPRDGEPLRQPHQEAQSLQDPNRVAPLTRQPQQPMKGQSTPAARAPPSPTSGQLVVPLGDSRATTATAPRPPSSQLQTPYMTNGSAQPPSRRSSGGHDSRSLVPRAPTATQASHGTAPASTPDRRNPTVAHQGPAPQVRSAGPGSEAPQSQQQQQQPVSRYPAPVVLPNAQPVLRLQGRGGGSNGASATDGAPSAAMVVSTTTLTKAERKVRYVGVTEAYDPLAPEDEEANVLTAAEEAALRNPAQYAQLVEAAAHQYPTLLLRDSGASAGAPDNGPAPTYLLHDGNRWVRRTNRPAAASTRDPAGRLPTAPATDKPTARRDSRDYDEAPFPALQTTANGSSGQRGGEYLVQRHKQQLAMGPELLQKAAPQYLPPRAAQAKRAWASPQGSAPHSTTATPTTAGAGRTTPKDAGERAYREALENPPPRLPATLPLVAPPGSTPLTQIPASQQQKQPRRQYPTSADPTPLASEKQGDARPQAPARASSQPYISATLPYERPAPPPPAPYRYGPDGDSRLSAQDATPRPHDAPRLPVSGVTQGPYSQYNNFDHKAMAPPPRPQPQRPALPLSAPRLATTAGAAAATAGAGVPSSQGSSRKSSARGTPLPGGRVASTNAAAAAPITAPFAAPAPPRAQPPPQQQQQHRPLPTVTAAPGVISPSTTSAASTPRSSGRAGRAGAPPMTTAAPAAVPSQRVVTPPVGEAVQRPLFVRPPSGAPTAAALPVASWYQPTGQDQTPLTPEESDAERDSRVSSAYPVEPQLTEAAPVVAQPPPPPAPPAHEQDSMQDEEEYLTVSDEEEEEEEDYQYDNGFDQTDGEYPTEAAAPPPQEEPYEPHGSYEPEHLSPMRSEDRNTPYSEEDANDEHTYPMEPAPQPPSHSHGHGHGHDHGQDLESSRDSATQPVAFSERSEGDEDEGSLSDGDFEEPVKERPTQLIFGGVVHDLPASMEHGNPYNSISNVNADSVDRSTSNAGYPRANMVEVNDDDEDNALAEGEVEEGHPYTDAQGNPLYGEGDEGYYYPSQQNPNGHPSSEEEDEDDEVLLMARQREAAAVAAAQAAQTAELALASAAEAEPGTMYPTEGEPHPVFTGDEASDVGMNASAVQPLHTRDESPRNEAQEKVHLGDRYPESSSHQQSGTMGPIHATEDCLVRASTSQNASTSGRVNRHELDGRVDTSETAKAAFGSRSDRYSEEVEAVDRLSQQEASLPRGQAPPSLPNQSSSNIANADDNQYREL